MSNTLKAVLKLLHKQYNRTKGFNVETTLFCPRSGTTDTPFNKKINEIQVDPGNLQELEEKIAKRFKSFSISTLVTVDYVDADGLREITVGELVDEIDAFMDERAAVKAASKVKKVKTPKEPAELSLFSFSDNFKREAIFEKERLTYSADNAVQINLNNEFWKAFDKWYGKNRKALLKKAKKSKKVGPHGFERVDDPSVTTFSDPSVTASSGNVFEDLNVNDPNKTHNLTANDGVYHPPVMQENNGEPGHIMVGSVELKDEDSANKPPNEKTLHVG